MSIVDSLRKLSLKLTGACSTGEDIEDNIEYIAENYSGGGSSAGVFMVEVGQYEDNPECNELKATWQEIHDAFVSGKHVITYIDVTNPTEGEYHQRKFIERVVYYPSETKPYKVSVGDNAFDCYTPDERPNTAAV